MTDTTSITDQPVDDWIHRGLDEEPILLSERDFADFIAAINSEPPHPTEALLAAVAEYNKHLPLKCKDVGDKQ